MSKVYVCYEFNSPSVAWDAGEVNNMFVTESFEWATKWVKRSVAWAKINNWLPVHGATLDDFMSKLTPDAESAYETVYSGGLEKSSDYYSICVEVYHLGDDAERLEKLFNYG